MDFKSYQDVQADIERNVVEMAARDNPEHREQIKSHSWFLDLSDMVWECSHCHGVLHSGERRFMDCKTSGHAHYLETMKARGIHV